MTDERSAGAEAATAVAGDRRPDDERLLARRVDFPALERFTWLQNGGVSLIPRPVHEEHVRWASESFERGPLHIAYPEEEYPRRARSRQRIARFLGVDEGEIAIVRGVTEAFQHVIRSIGWRAGDELVLSADEEGALLVPAMQLRDERGVVLRFLDVLPDGDPKAIVAQAREVLSPATRLLAFSHVTTDIGVRLPATELCALAESRGIPSFLDLAHSAGAIEVDLRELGPTYAGAVSYKWMMAPYGAGLLYVRADRLAETPIVYAGGRSDAWLDRAAGTMALHPDTRRFEHGPWNWPIVHAWARSVEYLDDLGMEAVAGRAGRLASRLKLALHDDPRVELFTPVDASRSANLIALRVEGWPGRRLMDHLRDAEDIVVRALMDEPDGIRASVAFFTTEAEVDALVDAIGRLPTMPP